MIEIKLERAQEESYRNRNRIKAYQSLVETYENATDHHPREEYGGSERGRV